jgi:hypothetical protein
MLQASVPKTREKVGRCLRRGLDGVLLDSECFYVERCPSSRHGMPWIKVRGIIRGQFFAGFMCTL